MDPVRDDSGLVVRPETAWPPRVKFQDRGWLHVLLFMLTLTTTTFVGALHYASLLAPFSDLQQLPMPFPALVLRGFWYSGTILTILTCHELGHYLACRYYDVDASLPFFLPVPPPFYSGTLGAFIRIRERIPRKHMLFDIGVAGPIAGFLVAVPALFIGLAMSTIAPAPTSYPPGTAFLGEPLLFRFAEWVFWRSAPDTFTLNLHPIGFAAWFGLLATSFNLIPAGQLDGGHIAYAVFGKISSYVTIVAIAITVALGFLAPVWFFWSGLMILMLYAFGRHHPPVEDEDAPLDRGRLLVAIAAAAILILCFMPAPIRAA